MSENKHTPEPLCPAALPFAILDQEMKDLMRFHECAMDDEGYDVPKDRMKRLAEIGLLRRVSANYYEHTTFGLAIINGEFEPADTIRKQRDELNVELAAEKESHASAYADALRQAEHLGRSVARIAELEKQRDELLAERNWPVMGYGKVAIGGCLQPDGTSALLYLDMGETRPIDADTTDLFPVGSHASPEKLLACVRFKDESAIQQTIDVLTEMKAEIASVKGGAA